MEELVNELVRSFEETITNEEEKEKLVKNFREMIIATIKSFKEDNYNDADIEERMKRISKRWIDLDEEEKRRRLLPANSLGKIMDISNEVYNIAVEKLIGNNVNVEFDISEKIDELENLLKEVESQNLEQAKQFVSEAILDLRFIEKPDTDILSLRLGHIKIDRKEEER